MNTIPPSDERELLDRLRAGEERAFRQVFFDYYAGMCLFARRYVGPESAEDIADDVFLGLLQSGRDFGDRRHLKAWLYRAVKHTCIDWLKRDRRSMERQHIFVEAQNAAQSESREVYLAHIMQTEAMRILYYALDALPEQTAKVLRLTYLDGMSNQEAADELKVSINTIKTQKQRGLIKLRQTLSVDHFKILLTFLFTSHY